MKRLFRTLGVLMLGASTLTSCLNDNDDIVSALYSDAAITGFSLSAINRYYTTTSSSTGNDTIVKTTLTTSSYAMTIDALNHRIYNEKELPVGTDVRHVLCTVSTKNSGPVAIKSMTSDSLSWFSTTDSIDFSQPRVLRVFSTDGTAHCDYTVTLNVSATTGLTFGWTKVTNIGNVDFSAYKAVATDTLTLAPVDSIVGASTCEKYMINADGQLCSSLDDGLTWRTELTDAADSLLPAAGTATTVCWSYAPADDTDYVLMVGQPRQSDATQMRVWRKISSQADGSGRWVYMPFDTTNHYPLARTDHFSMTWYDDRVLAIGSDMVMMQSRDQGISWRTATDHVLPANLGSATQLQIAADNKGRLWLVSDTGDVWVGQKM